MRQAKAAEPLFAHAEGPRQDAFDTLPLAPLPAIAVEGPELSAASAALAARELQRAGVVALAGPLVPVPARRIAPESDGIEPQRSQGQSPTERRSN